MNIQTEKKKIDRIINKLRLSIQKNGYYENLGQKELRDYLDTTNMVDYQNYCILKDYFNNQLDNL
jgi:hypothetical protein